ncbi:hypothetical protein BURMUCGD2_1756 [Burkholderia multivorans CGD2]|uniref:Uncharacterized protein n=1 Tax=Burkholderia multivorans CGD2 TaxID=513052 RepID=B9BY92_9BURK|nr:hypothetical protein BURMUCGD2_1756 [Burkholderia multivorans CGD2]
MLRITEYRACRGARGAPSRAEIGRRVRLNLGAVHGSRRLEAADVAVRKRNRGVSSLY